MHIQNVPRLMLHRRRENEGRKKERKVARDRTVMMMIKALLDQWWTPAWDRCQRCMHVVIM